MQRAPSDARYIPPMPLTERARDRGNQNARRMLLDLATELRDARHTAGISQARVALVAGLNQSRVSRTERAQRVPPRLDELARHCAALGLRMSIKVYPEGAPVRDAGQLRLLARFRALVGDAYRWRTEVPVAGRGDLRAWDVVLDGPTMIGIDAETRLHDVQALQRRCELKWRDGRLPCIVLVVARTRHNRAVLGEHRDALSSTFPLDSRAVLAALRDGRVLDGNGIVLV